MAKASDNEFPSVLFIEQTDPPITPDSGRWRIFTKSDGLYLVDDGGSVTGPFGEGGTGGSDDYICIQDQKSSGTHGGAFTTGAWRTRDLNTEVFDSGNHASISANQVTLAAGTYKCKIYVPGYYCGNHQARLRNITDNATTLVGTTTTSYTDGSATTLSIIVGRFTISGSKVFEVQGSCELTSTITGFGRAGGFGEIEIYTSVEFWKEA